MQNKINKIAKFIVIAYLGLVIVPASAEEFLGDEMSADAIAAYNPDGSLFQKITDLEQEKVFLQLEKEKAQLDLELDKLAAEKIKLHMEIDTLSGRADEQQQSLAAEKARLESEAAKLERERQSLSAPQNDSKKTQSVQKEEPVKTEIGEKYSLINIVGAGQQLQATLQDNSNGQKRKVSVGKTLDGYFIKSISLDEGVVFVKDGKSEILNTSKAK